MYVCICNREVTKMKNCCACNNNFESIPSAVTDKEVSSVASNYRDEISAQ